MRLHNFSFPIHVSTGLGLFATDDSELSLRLSLPPGRTGRAGSGPAVHTTLTLSSPTRRVSVLVTCSHVELESSADGAMVQKPGLSGGLTHGPGGT